MMSLKHSLSIPALLISVLGTAAFPTTSQARGFQLVRHNAWHEGRWVHDRHVGRLGWWWVVGPEWHYYSRPVYVAPSRTVVIEQAPPPVTVVQPAPPPVIAQAPAPSPTLYYCKATGTYYPETMTCPGGWSAEVAGAPPAP